MLAILASQSFVVACIPVGKQDAVRRLDAALAQSGVRTGTITVSSSPPTVSGASLSIAPSKLSTAVSLRVVIDAARHRAALLAPPAAGARIGPNHGGAFPAIAVFDNGVLFVRAVDAAAVGARPWLAVDVDHAIGQPKASTDTLAKPRTLGDLALISPIELLGLGRGLLTGSVTTPAPGQIDGRTSLDKDVRARDLDPVEADPLRHRLAAFAATDDINPLRVDLSPSGALLHLAVEFVGHPEYGVEVRTTFALDLSAQMGSTVPATPAAADVVRVNDLGDARNALDAWASLSGAGGSA